MNLLLILPILIPFITAILCLFVWGRVDFQERLTVLGMLVLLVVGLVLLVDVNQNGIQAVQMGDWKAPYGITFVADLLSAIMVTMTGLIGLMTALYSVVSMDEARERFGYYPLLNVLIMGVCGAFLTGDVFNLYVWFEVMLIASFVLLALGGERAQLEGAIKYVTLNLMSSAIFLMAAGILYSVTGTLNMADLHIVLGDVNEPGLVTVLAIMFMIAFGIKAAVFPLFFWLPASYHTPPVAITTVFSGLLTKVG
ncbi:MAG: Na+/H+ antiporter subunit D, partial [Anaerolineae bacterium]|nr:Na+/H+ antiporter subunit D [Anaerolineae bacterium]